MVPKLLTPVCKTSLRRYFQLQWPTMATSQYSHYVVSILLACASFLHTIAQYPKPSPRVHSEINIHINLRLDVAGSLRADAYAIQALRGYQDGKLILHPWIARGFTDWENVAEWYHEGSIDRAKAAMMLTKGQVLDIVQLGSLPVLDLTAEQQLVHEAEEKLLSGEKVTAWCISKPDGTQVLLPAWLGQITDKNVCIWTQEAETWENRLPKRRDLGKETLAPKQQEAYAGWQSTSQRIIVIHKSLQKQMKTWGEKTKTWLKKHCSTLTLHMTTQAENLRIRTGHGDWYGLKLLEGERTAWRRSSCGSSKVRRARVRIRPRARMQTTSC